MAKVTIFHKLSVASCVTSVINKRINSKGEFERARSVKKAFERNPNLKKTK
jgi:hypothetical protein